MDNYIRVKKPWGYEEIYPVGKLLFIKKGKRLSLQYHKVKWERMYLWAGEILVTIGAITHHLLPHCEPIEIEPGTIHRVEALEDSIIIELSTGELDDIVRISDDFGRKSSENTIR